MNRNWAVFITVDLEFLPWTTVSNANAALAVLNKAGRPANAGVLIDPLHMARSTTTLADIAALPRECLHYAQLCDGPGSGNFTHAEIIHMARFERLLPGEGSINLRGLFLFGIFFAEPRAVSLGLLGGLTGRTFYCLMVGFSTAFWRIGGITSLFFSLYLSHSERTADA